jgi:hypothetical protein
MLKKDIISRFFAVEKKKKFQNPQKINIKCKLYLVKDQSKKKFTNPSKNLSYYELQTI